MNEKMNENQIEFDERELLVEKSLDMLEGKPEDPEEPDNFVMLSDP